MRSIKKLTSMFLAVLMLMVTVSISASAYSEEICVRRTVGGGVAKFSRDYYFDDSRGIITVGYNKLFFDEATVKTFHTTTTHHGNVEFVARVDRTKNTAAGKWSDTASVRVDQYGTASYRAYLGNS